MDDLDKELAKHDHDGCVVLTAIEAKLVRAVLADNRQMRKHLKKLTGTTPQKV